MEVEGCAAVCGIGVNVTATPAELGAIGLDELEAHSGFSELAATLRDSIVGQVDAWAAAGGERPLDGVLDDYLALLAWHGERVRVLAMDGAEVACGTLDGVDVWGRAVVDGVAYASERVSLRPAR